MNDNIDRLIGNIKVSIKTIIRPPLGRAIGFVDKNGAEIKEGQKAKIIDSHGKVWLGIIRILREVRFRDGARRAEGSPFLSDYSLEDVIENITYFVFTSKYDMRICDQGQASTLEII